MEEKNIQNNESAEDDSTKRNAEEKVPEQKPNPEQVSRDFTDRQQNFEDSTSRQQLDPPQTNFSKNIPQQPSPEVKHENAPGVIVLQWLTYAFWGWTVLAASVLTGMVLASFIGDESELGTFSAYAIAAVFVLLPIALVTDHFYSKHEPDKKTGPAGIVMVIHAVIFALFAIGALITAVFSVVAYLVSHGDGEDTIISVITALIVMVLYLAVLGRTINPVRKFPKIRKFFKIFMASVVGIMIVLGILGPVAKEKATKDDRLIESNINEIKTKIDNYARKNNRLPASLDAIELRDEAETLVDKGLVTYKAIDTASLRVESMELNNSPNNSLRFKPEPQQYRYQLCATFKEAKEDRYGYDTDYDGSEYDTYINAHTHKAGENCYKLIARDY